MAVETPLGDAIVTTKLDAFIGWARKWSMFPYPFVTACCGMEYMSASAARYDLDRFTPRQADLLLVVGTINHKLAPVLKRVYDQMCDPRYVVAFGACTVSGGPYDNYAVVQGIDNVIPVDMYIPGCPPRPETVLDAVIKLQAKIQNSPQEVI